MTGEREKRAVARSKNRRQKSAQPQLPDRTLLEDERERQAVEKKVLEEERKELEEEKMKIEEERKRLAVEKVQVQKIRNKMDQKTKGRGRKRVREKASEEGIQVLGLLGFGRGKRKYLVSSKEIQRRVEEGMSSSAINALLRRTKRLNPNRFSTMTEGKVDDVVENFKEVLNKENYKELHLPFSENVRRPLEEALVKMRELFTLERSSSLQNHALAPKAFLASLEAMLATVQKQ
ncbi:hypothetical protein CAPTEDRAFT_193700 [Capitella teleta]|uniref:Uncharacterized protein n=1 Tax=Capitella teleta TaxID=283909 RepID=R7TDZ9_CAPTE|nr:hypothetical protein CAPTEDRAFT_193700 [Capitella teleta]|eukprot:ELT89707.1 hypothetical protein CAPTEDRAFT_193700 [Capitella teleta]